MKKLLIAALALITVLTMSLAACSDNQTPETDNTWDDEYVDNTGDDTTDDDAEGDDAPETPAGTWTAAAATVYTMTKSHIRENASTSSTKIDTVDMGTALQRTETNGTWDKITYNGATAYILSELVTISKNRVTFNDRSSENLVLHLEADKQTHLRTSPFYSDSDPDFNDAGILTSTITNGNCLKLLKLSADKAWAEVSFTGTLSGVNYDGSEKLYVRTTHIVELATPQNNDNIPG